MVFVRLTLAGLRNYDGSVAIIQPAAPFGLPTWICLQKPLLLGQLHFNLRLKIRSLFVIQLHIGLHLEEAELDSSKSQQLTIQLLGM